MPQADNEEEKDEDYEEDLNEQSVEVSLMEYTIVEGKKKKKKKKMKKKKKNAKLDNNNHNIDNDVVKLTTQTNEAKKLQIIHEKFDEEQQEISPTLKSKNSKSLEEVKVST